MSVFNQLVLAWKITKGSSSLEVKTPCIILKKNIIIYKISKSHLEDDMIALIYFFVLFYLDFCSLRITSSLCVSI